jgi:IclR family pca regulon transcriptional regulator
VGRSVVGAPVAPERTFVRSLERGLEVILAFDGDHPQRTLSDVARTTGLPRATARRFLLTLTELGYVRLEGGVFSLRPRVLDLGQALLSSLRMTDVATDGLQALATCLGESASLAVLDGQEVVLVGQVQPARLPAPAYTVGARLPAHATAAGRVLLAGLSLVDQQQYFRSASFTAEPVHSRARVRAALADVVERGYAIVEQELEECIWSVSAPVHARDGTVTAAVSASSHAGRWSSDRIAGEVVPTTVETAAVISRALAQLDGRVLASRDVWPSRSRGHEPPAPET